MFLACCSPKLAAGKCGSSKVITFDGRGTVSGTLSAMQQALAANPAAIITPADANALQNPIKDAVSRHIPVIGIHATAFPGPHPLHDEPGENATLDPKAAAVARRK